jgi:hypothetical protein
MSNPFILFSAPPSHIDFMRQHPGTSGYYYAGELPQAETVEPKTLSWLDRLLGRKPEPPPPPPPQLPEPPVDWPRQPPSCPDIDINHRNGDLYHRILNGTPEPVEGMGSIFQTKFHDRHDATPLDDTQEDFAFYPEKLPELLSLVEAVTPESLRHAFHEWCKVKENDHEPTLEEATEMHQEFVDFGKYLQQVIARNHGLVWFVNN